MLAEIAEQPHVIERTISREAERIERFAEGLDRHRMRLIVLVARGSSDNAALFGRYLLETTTGIPVSLAAPAVHTLYRAKLDLRDALVIGHLTIGRRRRYQYRARECAEVRCAHARNNK